MADFDLFDLVGLSFDPPETSAKLVKKKIEQKLTDLGSALGRETQQTKRDELQTQIDYLNGIVALILSPDGKKIVDNEFKKLADNKTAVEISSLSATVELLSLTGGRTVTTASIRHYKKESRLSVEHVKKIFEDAGFEIIDKDLLAAYPKFPTNADRIYSELAALRKTKDPNPNGIDTSIATDLYSFAAYISNDSENISLYRAMDTKELWGIFDPASRRYSQRNDDLGKLCGSLAASAKTYVFNSDENRVAYDRHLIYRSEELTKLFSSMKKAPSATLQSPKFADSCIKIICNYFPEYEVALAIYNKEAELDPPYMPPVWMYTIKCSFCGSVNEFESESDAMKSNSCHNCRKQLFKKCDKCKRLIPLDKEKCPHPDCGYVFVSAALFSRLFQQAEAAFRRSDFDSARQYLFQAQTAAPGEKVRIEQLQKKIDQEESVLKEPINRLKRLITERKFFTARSEMASIIGRFPNLNVSEFDRTISQELAKVDALFEAVKNYSSSKKADVCVSILLQCVDYAPALAFLHATTPIPCATINVTPVASSGAINVSWSHSSEQGVTYKLLRKVGNVASTSENDGEVLLNGVSATSYKDEDLKPGQLYSYSVFVERAQVFSTATSKTGVVFADVKNCHLVQQNKSIRITWDAPSNSRGSTISRSSDGKSTVLSEASHGSYEDTSIQYGKTYVYKIYANYGDGKRSPGVEQTITPLPIIDSFKIQVNQVKDNDFKITWGIREKGIDLRVMVNGKLTIETKSDLSFATISLPQNAFCSVSVMAFSGGKWISSENSVEINTFISCGINKKATWIEETQISGRNGISYRVNLHIVLSETIPANVSGFYYTVRKATSSVRWATIEEIEKSQDIQRIPIEKYRAKKEIEFQDFVLSDNSFFVSVFTIYGNNGREIVSEPQRIKIDRPLKADLFWSVSYGIFDGLKLNVEIKGNKAIDYIPKLILCISADDHFLASYDDKNSQVLVKYPSAEIDPPQQSYKKSYIIKTDLPSKILKKSKYYLFEEDITGNDSISLRWKQGFTGKV